MNSSKRRKKRGFSIASFIPTLSPLRWLWLVVLTIGTLTLAYHSMAFSIAMIARRNNPDLALRFVANEPVALATKADLQLLKSQTPKSLALAERWAKESIRQQPLNPTAVRILGYIADARGQRAKARELILLAEKLSRREFGAQLWLIEDAAARNDIKTALRHYDIALRTTAESPTILFPTLNDALALPEVRKGMVPYIREWPNWMTSYIGQAIGSVENPADVADIMLRAGKVPAREENRSIPDALLSQLAAKAKFTTLRQYYNSLPDARPLALTSAAMNASTVNLRYAAAGWQLTDNPALGGSFVKTEQGNGFSLHAFAGSGERGVLMTKLLFLTPGRYRLQAQYRAEESAGDAEIRWDINCPSATNSGNLAFATAKVVKGNSATALDFNIPAGCTAQQLVLQLAGGSSQIGAEFVLRSVSVQKVGTLN